MRYERIFKEAVEKYRESVEEIVGREIGELTLEPFEGGFFRRLFDSFDVAHGINIYLAEVTHDSLAKNKPVIRYNPAFIFNLLPRRAIEFAAVHELAHVAHLNGRSLGEQATYNLENNEIVADYVALKVLGEGKIPLLDDGVYQESKTLEENLQKWNRTLKYAIMDGVV